MISDIKKYKHGILTTKDKWGDSQQEKDIFKVVDVKLEEIEERLCQSNWIGGDHPC